MKEQTTDALAPRYHDDDTLTYWSVYQQVWVERTQAVPDRELAAMSPEERERVQEFLGRVSDEEQ